jgi:hypothetical protein
MRNELEQIQQIETYLNGTMPADERAIFETNLSGDAGLREAVDLQRELMKGIGRLALQGKVRAARRHYLRTRYLKWGGFGSGFVLAVIAVVLLTGKPKGLMNGHTQALESPERHLPVQDFPLDGSRDTVIVTKGGIVLAVPAGGFLDEHGQPVKGPIDIQFREALDPASILRSGLSTRSGDRWLETAGMFDFEVSQNGKPLRVNPKSALFARIPTDSVRKDMLVFTGKRLADGSIDWVNPREPEHFLIPVDIHALDFYPPHYLDSLRRWGHQSGNRAFTDSLYYSLARFFVPNKSRDSIELDRGTGGPVLPEPAGERPDSSGPYYGGGGSSKDLFVSLNCGINPAKIKTIWADPFQNTLVATREFEERMHVIHAVGDPKLLDLYINHLNLALSTIDSMAAGKVSGELRQRFLAFAARHEGGVAIGSKPLEQLKRYYIKKANEYTTSIARVQREFWNGQGRLDSVALRRAGEYAEQESARNLRIFDEYATANGKGYAVRIVETGWHNIDAYVPWKMSTPIIHDSAVVRVASGSGYDAVYVYLIPDQLSSFIRMESIDGRFEGSLWPRMKFSLIAIAYKDEQAYFYSQGVIHTGENPAITLTPVDKAALDRELGRLSSASQASDLRKEQEFRRFERQDNKRIRQNYERLLLTSDLLRFLYPCTIMA